MPVTTRDYTMNQAIPANVINALETAIADLGWHDPVNYGYVLTFSNTAGSTIYSEKNKRYLVNPSSTTGSGTKAVFDISRNVNGGVAAVTLVTGGSGYNIIGTQGSSSVGTTVTVDSTAGISAGMIVTRIAGTGTLPTNTAVVSVTNSTTLVIDQTPTAALSGAVLQFVDTATINGSAIGGTSYTTTGSAALSTTTLTVANATGIKPGQIVTGAGIPVGTVVSSVVGRIVTLSLPVFANLSTTSVTFDDGIFVTLATTANMQNLVGTVTAGTTTITNVANTNNIFVGARLQTLSGATYETDNGDVWISSITGSGPYTLTLRNDANTWRGFETSGTVTFTAARGTTTRWFGSDVFNNPGSSSYGIAKISNSTGKLGTSFWNFFCERGNNFSSNLYIRALTGFNPSAATAQGVSGLDWFTVNTPSSNASYSIIVPVSAFVNVPLTLRVRQSGVDSNFAVFQFIEGSTVRGSFFLSKYNNNIQPWSLNDVYLGGAHQIITGTPYNTNDAFIHFRTRMTGQPRRMAEAGYGNYWQTDNTTIGYTNTYFHTSSGNRTVSSPGNSFDNLCFYSRQPFDIQSDVSTVAVFKNIPINPAFAPVPYYLPNDFVLAEIQGFNVAIGDTITVTAGVEVYTAIVVATNAATLTSLILAARTTG